MRRIVSALLLCSVVVVANQAEANPLVSTLKPLYDFSLDLRDSVDSSEGIVAHYKLPKSGTLIYLNDSAWICHSIDTKIFGDGEIKEIVCLDTKSNYKLSMSVICAWGIQKNISLTHLSEDNRTFTFYLSCKRLEK